MTKVDEDVSATLEGLECSLEANGRDQRLLLRRLRSVRAAHAAGAPWRDALARQGSPGLLELSGRMLERLGNNVRLVRRAIAAALREEGLTASAIGETLGVSRQRIAKLLSRTHR